MSKRRFCNACRNMVLAGEFTRSNIICDWCARTCFSDPPPRCHLCGMMRLTTTEADSCCTPAGWKEK